MADPVPMAIAPPSLWVWGSFLVAGLVWGVLLGLASRPRWSATPGWWPARGRGASLSYGAASGLAFVAIVVGMILAGIDVGLLPLLLLSASWVIALGLVARIGHTPEVLKAHLVSGAIVLAVALVGYLALELWFASWGSFPY